MVNKLIKRLIWKYKAKLVIVAILVSLIIGIFTALNNSQLYVANNISTLHDKYNSFDFKFDQQKSTENQILTFAKKYQFDYKIESLKTDDFELKTKNQNENQVLFDLDSKEKSTNKFNITFMKQRNNSYANSFLIKGKFASKQNEINVSRDFLNKSGYNLNDNIVINQINYKIVGIFADQNNQSITQSDNLLQNIGHFDVIVSNSSFSKLNIPTTKVILARFKNKLTYEQRKEIYKKMSNDVNFTITTKVDKIKNNTKNITAVESNICNQKTFNGYLKNKNLSESNFNYLQEIASKSLNSNNRCKLNFSDDPLQNQLQLSKSEFAKQKGYKQPIQSIYDITPKQLHILDEVNRSKLNLGATSNGIIIDSANKYLNKNNLSQEDKDNFIKDITYNYIVNRSNNDDFFNQEQESLLNNSKKLKDYSYDDFIEKLNKSLLEQTKIDKPKTFKVNYNQVIGQKEVKNLVFNSFSDIEEIPGSKEMFLQLKRQQTLIIYLGIIFITLLILVTSIVLTQIIKSINIEVGTLKAIGASDKFITKKFMAFVQTLISLIIIFSIITIVILQLLVLSSYNSKYSFVNENYFIFDFISNPIMYLAIITFIYFFAKKALTKVLKDNTLLLLKNLNTKKSIFKEIDEIKHPKFGKFWNEVIIGNGSKTIIIFFIGIIMSIFAGTLLILFSNVSSYLAGGNGVQFENTTKIILENKTKENILSNVNDVNLKNIVVEKVLNQNNEPIVNISKPITKSTPINISIFGIEREKIGFDDGTNSKQSFDSSNFEKDKLDNGLLLANKYHVLYNLNQGDKLQVFDKNTNKEIIYNISGFLPENENIFAYTSNTYLQSINDNKRETNAQVKIDGNSVYDNIDYAKQYANSLLDVGKLKAIKINKNQEIIAIIIQALIVLTVLLLPIMVIIVSDIVDSNTKTIATMRAIGISKFKIRLSIIQPFSIIYLIGTLIGAISVVSGFASQFSAIFYSFINVDIVYSNDFYILLGVIVIIWIIYESVISIAFTRISVISLAKTLNDDSARTQITKDDLSRYYKSSAKSILDFNKKPFYYQPTKIAKLKKPVSRSFWMEVFKYVWPYFVSNAFIIIETITTAITTFLLALIPSQTLQLNPEVQVCLSFVTGSMLLNIFRDRIISVATTYATQYYRQNKKAQFKRSIAFSVQISIGVQLLITLGIILFGQLGMQSADIPLSSYKYLGVGIFAAFVQQIIVSFSLPYQSAITASGDTKVLIANKVIQIFTSVSASVLALIFGFTKDIDIYLFTFFVMVINSIGDFVPIIYGNIVKRHKHWAGGTWKYLFSFKHPVNSRIFSKSIPYIISSILETFSSVIQKAIYTILGLSVIAQGTTNAATALRQMNWIMPINFPDILHKLIYSAADLSTDILSYLSNRTSILAIVVMFFIKIKPFFIFDFMDYFMKRILARRNYYFAVQIFNNIVKNIFLFLVIQFIVMSLITFGCYELFTGSGTNNITWNDVMYIISWLAYGSIIQFVIIINKYFLNTLEAGGEFKFTQFVNIVFNYLNVFALIISIMLHLDLISIMNSTVIIKSIQIWIYYNRLKTGRWLSCVTDDVTIHSTLRGWKDKKLILQKIKDKRYLKQLIK